MNGKRVDVGQPRAIWEILRIPKENPEHLQRSARVARCARSLAARAQACSASQKPPKIDPKSLKNRSKIAQKSIQNRSKIGPKMGSVLESILEGAREAKTLKNLRKINVFGGSGGPRCAQDAPKTAQDGPKLAQVGLKLAS